MELLVKTVNTTPDAVNTKPVNLICRCANQIMIGHLVLSVINFHHAVTIMLPTSKMAPNMWIDFKVKYGSAISITSHSHFTHLVMH